MSAANGLSTRRVGMPGRLVLHVRPRAVLVGVCTLALLLVLAVLSLTMGRLGIPLGELWTALSGHADGKEKFVFEELRGPRLSVAIGAGAALGVSGLLFQSGTRNPLASPDVVGMTAGAGAGAVVATLWIPLLPLGVGAFAGAAAAAGLVYLSTGSGFAVPSRIILAGVGVSAMATAFIQYVVMIKDQDESLSLAGYLAGTLSARTWGQAQFVGWACLVLLPCALALGPRLRLMELGDAMTDSLGARAGATRSLAILIAVALCAAAVSAAGPIAFVALTAPQIARRLVGGPQGAVVISALTGAVILAGADLWVQQAGWLGDLPVGILTAALGGVYLGALLVKEWKKGSA
ncbi:FecCD family ABC transporter permease [Flexivirga aerilata]